MLYSSRGLSLWKNRTKQPRTGRATGSRKNASALRKNTKSAGRNLFPTRIILRKGRRKETGKKSRSLFISNLSWEPRFLSSSVMAFFLSPGLFTSCLRTRKKKRPTEKKTKQALRTRKTARRRRERPGGKKL